MRTNFVNETQGEHTQQPEPPTVMTVEPLPDLTQSNLPGAYQPLRIII